MKKGLSVLGALSVLVFIMSCNTLLGNNGPIRVEYSTYDSIAGNKTCTIHVTIIDIPNEDITEHRFVVCE